MANFNHTFKCTTWNGDTFTAVSEKHESDEHYLRHVANYLLAPGIAKVTAEIAVSGERTLTYTWLNPATPPNMHWELVHD